MKQNSNRLYTLDVTRGFTVLFIPVIHSWMMFAGQQAQHSPVVSFLSFIAEWPGAQLFMVHMGVGFSYRQSVTFKSVCIRALLLLTIGYGLNILKFVLPYALGILPDKLQIDIQAANVLSLFCIGDILHFAALALPVLFILKKLPHYGLWSIVTLFLLCFASPHTWSAVNHISSPFLQYGAGLFSGAPPQTYFPFFPWIVYPLAGLCVGYFLQEHNSVFFLPLFIIGLMLFLPGYLFGQHLTEEFYRTTPWKTLQHLGFVCCWLPAWYVFLRLFSKNKLFTFFEFLGKNITIIYLIQWPLICWLLPLLGYKCNGTITTISYAFTITVITIALTKLVIYLRTNLNFNSG